MAGNYRISGAVFPKDKGPAFSGTIEIDGVKHHISLWEKTSGAGNAYLQISEDKYAADRAAKKDGGGANKFRRQPASANKPDMDDDIPF